MTEYRDPAAGNESPPALLEVLVEYDRVLEVGIGQRTTLAAAVAEAGVSVTAVDVVDRRVPEGVAFVREDVTDPELTVYTDVEAIYALRLPPDIQRPVAEIADRIGVPLLFTTLGTDPVVVPTEVRMIRGGTLYVYKPGESPGQSG